MRALDHRIGGVPARTHIADGFFFRNFACGTLASEHIPTLSGGVHLDHKEAELGNTRQLPGLLHGFLVVEVGLGSCLKLVQQCLHSQVRDVGDSGQRTCCSFCGVITTYNHVTTFTEPPCVLPSPFLRTLSPFCY